MAVKEVEHRERMGSALLDQLQVHMEAERTVVPLEKVGETLEKVLQ